MSAPTYSPAVERILHDFVDRAAEAFGDARRLVAWLHSEGHPADKLARDVALAVAEMAGKGHDAAEIASLDESEVMTW